MNSAPTTANATFCATLVDQFVREGLTHAFVAPGSRSTPLALAIAARTDLCVSVFHDERAAAFAALGHGLASKRPGLVLCTSGTAAAHFYAAVIEADASAVPLIVCTADRPPELWGRGAPQTIDQTELYGHRVRDFVEPGPPDDVDAGEWRLTARRLWHGATGTHPGPVHANLSFRDPLTGIADALPPLLTADAAPRRVSPVDAALVATIAAKLTRRHGVIVAGRSESDGADIVALAQRLGWPLIADHRSGARSAASSNVVQSFDSLLRVPQFVAAHRPDVVLRIGEILASKVTSQWLTTCGEAEVIASRPHGRSIDPEAIADLQFDEAGVIAALLAELTDDAAADGAWLASWRAGDRMTSAIVAETLAAGGVVPNEVTIARQVVSSVPAGGALVVSSSMPVRDVEWFGPARQDISVLSNRGANGIDGVVSTSIGVALTGIPTTCLIGDVALLHDSTALVALRDRPVDLTIVVVDNDGGGIFSFLPQHELLPRARYEQFFGTPHGTDLEALAAAHRITSRRWSEDLVPDDLRPDGVKIVIATTDRRANLALHRALEQAVVTRFSVGVDETGRAAIE